jgi:signal transduction histidine kinase
MRERARLLGGTFDIRGEDGAGTTLTVRIPAPQAAPAILSEPQTSNVPR